MHPRLSRNLGVLLLAIVIAGIGAAAVPRDDEPFRNPEWWEPVAEAMAGIGGLFALIAVVAIAIDLVRGTYSEPAED